MYSVSVDYGVRAIWDMMPQGCKPSGAGSCFPLFKNEDLRFEELVSGQMEVQHFSPRIGEEKGLVEGTFECELKNTETDSIVNITNGYFRFRIEHT